MGGWGVDELRSAFFDRSRSVCGYTSRVRVGGDKENEVQESSSSSGIFSCRRPPGMAALARRNEAEIVVVGEFRGAR